MSTTRETRWEKVTRFWCDDLPPLDGRLRTIFYLLLLGGAWASNSWTMILPEFTQQVDLSLFLFPKGIFHTLGVGLPSHGVLGGIRLVLLVCWLAAAFGLLWRFTAPLTALAYFLLYGLAAGMGITHAGHVAMYTLISLCFCRADDRFTLDTILGKRFLWYRRLAGSPGSLTGSGFGRKVALLGAVFSLFGGGVSKLWVGGLAWLDGRPIELFVLRTLIVGEFRFPPLGRFLLGHLPACSLAAMATVAFELSSICALFSRRARPFILAAACVFHIGILLVMVPAFWLQMISYIPCLDWGELWHRLRRRAAAPPLRESTTPPPRTLGRSIGAALGCGLLAMWLAIVAARLEYWPVSSSPMYADYITRQSLAAMVDPKVRQDVARRALAEDPIMLQLALSMVCPLRIVDSQAGRVQYIRPRMGTGGWERVFFASVVRDLADPEAGPLAGQVGRLLATHLAVIVPEPGGRVSPIPQVFPQDVPPGFVPDRVEIVCGFDRVVRDFPAAAQVVVIGAAKLGDRERTLLSRRPPA